MTSSPWSYQVIRLPGPEAWRGKQRPGLFYTRKTNIQGGPPDMPEVVHTAPPNEGRPPCAATVLSLGFPRSS